MEQLIRPRRLRSNEIIRNMVRETRISIDSLVYPLFIEDGLNIKDEISAMLGQYRYSIDRVDEEIKRLLEAGINKVLLFGIPKEKDEHGCGAYDENGIIQRAVAYLKEKYEDLYIITDICMCEYTSHGHCGILHNNTVDNDQTLAYLQKIALSHVRAGADMVAPSDMMDGRIKAIRIALDDAGYTDIPIMSYSVKYSSSFYGPFREAAGSAPQFGNRKGYQMDYHNRREAIKETLLDIEEGADILMVKPALSYLDILREVREVTNLPLAAYSVSGEYSMVIAGAQSGWIDKDSIICEMAVSAFRAGADIYITYFAKELAGFIKEGRIG